METLRNRRNPLNKWLITVRQLVSSVAQSCLTLRPHELQRTRLPCPSPTPGACSNSSISNHLILCHPLLVPPSIFPSISGFSNESVLRHQVAKVLEFQLQHQSLQQMFRTDFLQDGLVGSPCSPRDSQEFSSISQFKSISSSVVSFFSPTLTSIHDYWKNHSFV